MLAPDEIFARRYRIVRVLGRGAMGVVHEAVHAQLGHRVAIKVLRHGESEDERAVRRFEREARLAAKLTSPHVVRVSDVDRTDDGIPFLVMELLEGHDLATEVEERENEGPIAIADAVTWALAIADAMVEAHDAGIVHRDLKLSNVFLTNGGTIKVLDFGVASFRGGDAESSTTMSVAGTPRYMAPEQLLGEAPNPASDVWALGVILYRVLAGVFPYDAPTMAAQMLAIMEGDKRLDDVAPRVPAALANVVHKALGRTLEERWSSMGDLRAALAPFVAAPADVAAAPADVAAAVDEGSVVDADAFERAKLEANERAFDRAHARVKESEAAADEDARGQRRGKGFVIVLALGLVAVIMVDFMRRSDGPRPAPLAASSAPSASASEASPVAIDAAAASAPSVSTATATATARVTSDAPSASPRASAGEHPRAGAPAIPPGASRPASSQPAGSSAPAPRDDGFPAHL